MPKKTTDQLIESLYAFTREGFNRVGTKLITMDDKLTIMDDKLATMDDKLATMDDKLDRVAGFVSGHEGRISALEDSMRVIKTKLQLN